jgi:endonuclease/exonuclease/phosphatase (EEP) superfamily protein YafD
VADRPTGLGVIGDRRGRGSEFAAWIAVAAMAVATSLPWIRSVRGRLATVVRSLSPWAAIPGVPLALLASMRRHRGIALAAGTVSAVAAATSAPLIGRRRQPLPAADARPLSILHANLLFDNIRMPDVARVLERIDADVLTFSEYTPHHARILWEASAAAAYPHRIEKPAALASGAALWSRHPVTAADAPATRHHTVVGDLDGPGGPVRIIVVHAQSPVVHHVQWSDDLAVLALVDPGRPAVMTGDFNASWWHPEFRQLLARGWRDVHQVVGRGLSASWPVDRPLPPAFIRLDHALVNDGLAVESVTDVDIPGSDHRGLLVTVRRAR